MSVRTCAFGLAAAVMTGVLTLPAHATILTATNKDFLLLDASTGTRSVNLGGGIISNVSVIIDFTKCSNLQDPQDPVVCDLVSGQNSWPGDIFFRLVGPAPTSTGVTLIDSSTYPSNPDPGPFSIKVELTDQVSNVVGASGAISETARSITQQLDLFNGQDAAGTWVLEVEDGGADAPLLLNFFTLNVTVRDRPTGQTPVPGTLALLGLGLAGLGAMKRRRA